MKNIAIVVIAFNRPKSLERLLNSLSNLKIIEAEEIPLYISIDKAKNEDVGNSEVFKIAKEFNWKFGEKIVNYRKQNLGLRRHILECGNLTNIYENIIVLEDDIVVSPMMYMYAKQVINYYKDQFQIAGFGLYSFQRNPINNLPFYPIDNGTDVYFMQYACSWGQIWTKDRWNNFYSWYKENKDKDFSNYSNIPQNVKQWGENSWLKYHVIYTILNNKYFVYPQRGLTTDFTDSGTHNKINCIAYQCYMFSENNKIINFKFESIDKASNIYDAFFENIKLNEIIGCNNNIISDFFGKKSKEYIESQAGYLLSTNIYDYKILDKYSLQMYPYELNIVNKIKGEDIFLYDKDIEEKNKNKYKEDKLLRYSYRLDLLSKKYMICLIKSFFKDLKNKIIRKIKRK